MEILIRSLWVARATTGATLLCGAVVVLLALPKAPTVLGLVLALLAEGAASLAQVRLVDALRDGRRGEVLLKAGARVPLATMFGYATDLRSKTQGRATYTMQFSQYDPVPTSVQEEIVARITGVAR